MNHEERKQLIAQAAVRMAVKPAARPPAPPRPPRLDSHLPGEIARLEVLVADRERQVAALREQHHAQAALYDTRRRGLEDRVAEARNDVEVLEQLAEHLRGSAQASLDAAAAECARITAAAQERAAGVLTEAAQAATEAGAAGRELEALELERVTLEGKGNVELGALLDQVDRLQHGRYADAQRRLPDLRERLAARQAEVEAWEAARAAEQVRLDAKQALHDPQNEAIRQRLEAEDAAAAAPAAETVAEQEGGPTP